MRITRWLRGKIRAGKIQIKAYLRKLHFWLDKNARRFKNMLQTIKLVFQTILIWVRIFRTICMLLYKALHFFLLNILIKILEVLHSRLNIMYLNLLFYRVLAKIKKMEKYSLPDPEEVVDFMDPDLKEKVNLI